MGVRKVVVCGTLGYPCANPPPPAGARLLALTGLARTARIPHPTLFAVQNWCSNYGHAACSPAMCTQSSPTDLFRASKGLKRHTHGAQADKKKIFWLPVNTAALTKYLEVIEQPMDLGTVKRRLETGHYDDSWTEAKV